MEEEQQEIVEFPNKEEIEEEKSENKENTFSDDLSIGDSLPQKNCMIEREINSIFHFNDRFLNPTELKKSLAQVGNKHGFLVRREGMSIVCNRGRKPRKPKEKETPYQCWLHPKKTRKRRKPELRCDCPFKICFTYNETATVQEQIEGAKSRYSDKIHITSICATHGNGCNPGDQQIEQCIRASGAILDRTSEAVWQAVDLVMKTDVSAKDLRKFLQPVVPKNYVLTSQDIANFRQWAKKNGNRTRKENIQPNVG
jgi:hypothetical protein